MHENACKTLAEQESLRFKPYTRSRLSNDPRSIPPPVDPTSDVQVALNNFQGNTTVLEPAPAVQPTESNEAVTVAVPANALMNSSSNIPSRAYPHTRSRARQLRTNYREECDALPEPPPPLDDVPPAASSSGHCQPRQRIHTMPFETPVDSFGRYRIYTSRPTTIPDSSCTLADFSDIVAVPEPDPDDDPSISPPLSVSEALFPCPNLSTFLLQSWFWKGGVKSQSSREDLRENVLLQPGFNPQDVAGVNFHALDQKLAIAAHSDPSSSYRSTGWSAKTVSIDVPNYTKSKSRPDHIGPTPKLSIHGMYSRSLLDVVRKGFSQNDPHHFHYEPYESRWIPPGANKSDSQRLSGELYCSPVMIEAHKEVQRLSISDASCKLPRVVGAVMLGSDGLALGSFTTKKAWPLYGWLGNFSKYERCKPTSNSCVEVAHIPSLPDNINDILSELNGRPPSAGLLTHLRRELMHAVLNEILDDDFLHAWYHGIVIQCADGIKRRVFPRLFTYSADYPEKVMLATVRDKGHCPCPRCLVPMDRTHLMGKMSDMRLRKEKRRKDSAQRRQLIKKARKVIYEDRRAIGNTEVEKLLQSTSLVPTVNAFSNRLSGLKFDFHNLFVVDLLHEVELGVWKSFLTHLLRILHGCGNSVVTEFNKRFRRVPTFGNSTIRLFSEDVASMKRLAARDFEDILQCCIPVFQGLLPAAIDPLVQNLLFTFAYWHALAKLRLHTSSTIQTLTKLTTKLGEQLREFQEQTATFEVYEAPREFQARQRRAAARASSTASTAASAAPLTRKKCALNLNTYKFHAIGDYPETITQFGTTDSFSTQTAELHHRKIKAQWERTNYRDAVPQMTRIGDIGDALDNIEQRLEAIEKKHTSTSTSTHGHGLGHLLSDVDGELPYFIGQAEQARDALSIPLWVSQHRHELWVKFFIPQLKEHLLYRLDPNSSPSEIGRITFHNDRMYAHATLRINYTSYDVRRQQDTIFTRSSSRFIMLLNDSPENRSTHPFLYAEVLGIYHVNVQLTRAATRRPPKRMDFLWIRWLDYDLEQPGGWNVSRLDRLCYPSCRNEAELLDAYGFVDPAHVVRASHLIPDFHSGVAERPRELGRASDGIATTWNFHYVNRFVDRDMLMRYLGGGIGHFNQAAPMNDAIEVEASYELDDEEAMDWDVEEPNAEPSASSALAPANVTSGTQAAETSMGTELGDGNENTGDEEGERDDGGELETYDAWRDGEDEEEDESGLETLEEDEEAGFIEELYEP